MIEEYLNHVIDLLASAGAVSADAEIARVGDVGSVAATIVFTSCILRVALTAKQVPGYYAWLYYSFHCQAFDDTCIFRYDMAPHHPEIPTHPHHKHIGGDERAVPSGQPTPHHIRLELMQHLGIPQARG